MANPMQRHGAWTVVLWIATAVLVWAFMPAHH
jgi:hypothetical protein